MSCDVEFKSRRHVCTVKEHSHIYGTTWRKEPASDGSGAQRSHDVRTNTGSKVRLYSKCGGK